MKLSDIKPNPDNPRSIEGDRDAALDESLEKYGDLSGVVYNSNPECPALVSAHQRLRKFKKDKWKLIVTERFKEPQSKGTVAWGYVESPDGERYVYREVNWPKRKADEATIVANGQFGKWDADVLSRWEFEVDDLRDMGVPEWVFGGGHAANEMSEDDINALEEFDPVGVAADVQRVVFIFDNKGRAEDWLKENASGLTVKKMNMAWQINLSTLYT